MEDWEREQKLQDLDHLDEMLNLKKQRDFAKWQNHTIQDELRQAADEFGLKPEDVQKHFSDPNYEKDLRKSVRKLVEKNAKRVGKTHGGSRGRPMTTRDMPVRGTKEVDAPIGKFRSISEAKAAVAKGAIISDDDLMELLPKLI